MHTLGAEDTRTGWFEQAWLPAATVKAVIESRTPARIPTGGGAVIESPAVALCKSAIAVGAWVTAAGRGTYQVLTVNPVTLGDQVVLYEMQLSNQLSNTGPGGGTDPSDPGGFGFWVLAIQVVPSTAGSTAPAAGIHIYDVGQSVTVTATGTGELAWNSFFFDGAKVDGNPYTVAAQAAGSVHFLVAAYANGSTIPIKRTDGKSREQLVRGAALGYTLEWSNSNFPQYHLLGNAHDCCKVLATEMDLLNEDFAVADVAIGVENSINKAEAGIITQPSTIFGNNANGTGTNYTNIENQLCGSLFTVPAGGLTVYLGYAYVLCTTANKAMKMAIYRHSDLALLAESVAVTVTANAAAQRVQFSFTGAPTLTELTDVIIVVASASASGSGYVYWTTGGAANQGHYKAITYPTFPNPIVTPTHDANKYCVYLLCA